MQTSLARRQRHRRTIHRRPAASGGSHVVRRILIAIPIVVITLAFLAGFVGVVFAVGVYNQYATGLPDPEAILSDLDFRQGDGVIAFVNGMGASPLIELYLMYGEVAAVLEKAGVTVVR